MKRWILEYAGLVLPSAAKLRNVLLGRLRFVKLVEYSLALSVSAAVSVSYTPPGRSPIVHIDHIVAGLLLFQLLLSTKFHVRKWHRTKSVLGLPKAKDRATMRRLSSLAPSQRSQFVDRTYLVWFSVCALLWYFTGSITLFVMVAISIQRVVVLSLNGMMPPAVLLLSTSSEESLRLQSVVNILADRLRVVTLFKGAHPNLIFGTNNTRGDSFRTELDADWQSVTRDLARLSRVIVLDVRKLTDPMLFEASLALSPENAFKTILLCGPKGDRPVLEQFGAWMRDLPTIPIIREETLAPLIGRLFQSDKLLPSSSQPLASCLVKLGVTVIDRQDWDKYPRYD